jgi:hypothetical protein
MPAKRKLHPSARVLGPVAVVVLALMAPFAAARQQPASSCERCHQDAAHAEAERPHARAGVSCTSCHGGDATKDTKEAAKAAGSGYRGVLHGAAIVTLCGDCHADIVEMNPYGLRTDQLAQYRTSRHGIALFEKSDESVATCAACHGAHGILGPASSESSVHPANVPATCAKCHGDETLMKAHNLDATIPTSYHASIHATFLLEKGDSSAPECATCHGSHGAVPPGFHTVNAVCGKCHVRERELFGQSPHAPLVEQGEFDGCETCHGNHEVREASPVILERMCELCHGGEEQPLATRDRILSALQSSRALLASTEAELQHSEQLGLVTDDDHLLLQQARTALEQAQVGLHALDPAAIEETAAEVKNDLDQLSGRLERERRGQRLRRLVLVPVVLFLGLMSLGSWFRFRRIHGA